MVLNQLATGAVSGGNIWAPQSSAASLAAATGSQAKRNVETARWGTHWIIHWIITNY